MCLAVEAPANILLSGVVGSTAYGLATPDSDIDWLGNFAAPTHRMLGLHAPKDSIVSTNPDRTLHETAKWCRLALGGNPTVMDSSGCPTTSTRRAPSWATS